jgi:hypothetical protein
MVDPPRFTSHFNFATAPFAGPVELWQINEEGFRLIIVVYGSPERRQTLLPVQQILGHSTNWPFGGSDMTRYKLLWPGDLQHERHPNREIADYRIQEARNPASIPGLEPLKSRQLNRALVDVVKPGTQCAVLGFAGLLHDTHP